MPTALSTGMAEKDRQKVGTVWKKENHPRRTSVVDSMVRTDAGSWRRNAITNTYAKDVVRPGMEGPPALPTSSNEIVNGLKPKHLRYNIWDPDSEFTPNTADWTLTARLLEGPPQSASDDEPVTRTLQENPHLFKVVTRLTPVRVDIFETYLASHPNRNFVDSVCRGLCEGFWPWAITPSPGFPTINDES